MLSKIYDPLISLAFPQACENCLENVEHSADGIACRNCWTRSRLFIGNEILCHKCGRFLGDGTIARQTFCHQCDDHFYDRAAACGLYSQALAASVLHLKHDPFIARSLEKIFVERFRSANFPAPDAVFPVPLSKQRKRERGFNQAAVLTDILVRETGLTADKQSLIRKIHTPRHRAGMDRKTREQTVKNAFRLRCEQSIKGKTILLIDDVFTTGATVSSCAKELKKNGADKVYVLTLARAD